MSLHDRDIESRVVMIAAFLLKDTKIKPEEQPIIQAGVELITNLLQNINDIAENGYINK